MATLLLEAWGREHEGARGSREALQSACAPAVRLHLLDAYGWFLLATLRATRLPDKPPHHSRDLPELGAGIAERDIQTTQFSIQPRYTRETRKADGTIETRKLEGYTVRNGVNVRVRDIDAVGEVLDMSVRLGVNEGGDIQFSNADPTKALGRARSNAVKDALDKARGLASAAGGKVGRVLEISEHNIGARPMNMARREMAMDSMKASVPIAAGENTYRVSISLSVALEQ